MAGVRVSFTETLDLTAVNNYDNEIKKSLYNEDVEKHFELTSQILKNVMHLFNRDGDVSPLNFDGLNEQTKAKLARIFLDHAINAKILSSRVTSFIIVTPDELNAYFDTAIRLCTTEADKHKFQAVKQNPLAYYNERIKENASGQESKKPSASSDSATAKRILTPTQVRDKLDNSIVPKNLVVESFDGNDTHLAAAARTIYDSEGTMNSVVTTVFEQMKSWKTEQLYNYLTRPITTQDHHSIISLGMMNANKFLSILMEKIETTKRVGFQADELIKKLASYRVPNGKDKGESLFTLAIKYGDFNQHYNKLISIYNRHLPPIRTAGKAGTQPNPLFVSATDCMGRKPLDIAREAYFDTVAEFGYHSRQANMTFNMILNFSKGISKESLWNKLQAECTEREIVLDIPKKAGKSAASSSQPVEAKSTPHKPASSKKRKRTEEASEPAKPAATDRVVAAKGKDEDEAKASSTVIDGFTLIASDRSEIVKTVTDNNPSKKAKTISDSTAEASATNSAAATSTSSAASLQMDVDTAVATAASSSASASASTAVSDAKTSEDTTMLVATPAASTSTTAQMRASLAATPASASVLKQTADADMKDAKQASSDRTSTTSSSYVSLSINAPRSTPVRRPLPQLPILSQLYTKRSF